MVTHVLCLNRSIFFNLQTCIYKYYYLGICDKSMFLRGIWMKSALVISAISVIISFICSWIIAEDFKQRCGPS